MGNAGIMEDFPIVSTLLTCECCRRESRHNPDDIIGAYFVRQMKTAPKPQKTLSNFTEAEWWTFTRSWCKIIIEVRLHLLTDTTVLAGFAGTSGRWGLG